MDTRKNEKSELLLSFIVPVYNVGKYVSKCLESLLHQNISKDEYEIVCVDDGSTDKSGEILEEYAKDNKIIKVIHQENGGLSAARNTGIRNASGKYFWFVDSDDFIKSDILGEIKDKLIETDCDCLSIRPYSFNDGAIFDEDSIGPEQMDRAWKSTLWTKVLKARHIVENSLFFQTSFTYIEDAPFMIQLSPFLKNIIVIEKIGYFYRHRAGSLMGQKIERKIENRFRVSAFCQDIIDGKIPGDREKAKYFLYACISNAMGNISKFSHGKRNEFLKKYKESDVRKLKLNKKYTSNTVKKSDSVKNRIIHKLNDYSYKKPVFRMLVLLHHNPLTMLHHNPLTRNEA